LTLHCNPSPPHALKGGFHAPIQATYLTFLAYSGHHADDRVHRLWRYADLTVGQLQVKITKEVTLLDELSRLTGTMHQLGLTHRMDVGPDNFNGR
jgi:hypothetical protein